MYFKVSDMGVIGAEHTPGQSIPISSENSILPAVEGRFREILGKTWPLVESQVHWRKTKVYSGEEHGGMKN